jgi:hypothetical protein
VKADVLKRFQAYDLALRMEFYKLMKLGQKRMSHWTYFHQIGLADVLFNPVTKQIYTPNTNKMMNMGQEPEPEPAPVDGESPPTGNPQSGGGDNNANRDPGQSGTT